MRFYVNNSIDYLAFFVFIPPNWAVFYCNYDGSKKMIEMEIQGLKEMADTLQELDKKLRKKPLSRL